MTASPEELKPGQSSKSKEVVYVKPRDFGKRSKKLARRDATSSVYTESPESRMQNYGTLKEEMVFKYFPINKTKDLKDLPISTFRTDVQAARDYATRRLGTKELTHEQYATRINFYNVLERTVMSILKEYRGYDLTVVMVYHNIEGRTAALLNTQKMHTDDRHQNRNTINIVATFDGESTQFEGKDERIITIPNNSMVAFAGGTVMHRSPHHGPNRRMALIVELRSSLPTKR